MPRYFTPTLRRRLAPVVLIVGLLISGKLAYDRTPREQALRLALPADRQDLRALRITYTVDGDELAGMERRFPDGAPATVDHSPSLAPGRYDMAIELTDREGRIKRLKRSLTVPAEGTLRISLDDGR